MRTMKIIVLLVLLFLTSGALTYFAVNAFNHNSADDEQEAELKQREELNHKRSDIIHSMSSEAKQYMETERKMQVKAYHKAYDSLTPEEIAQYKEVRAKIKENSDAERAFFDSLTPEQKKALKSAPNQNNMYHMEVDQSVRDKVRGFANRNLELEGQIPEKIQNIELDPVDKEALEKMRTQALTSMGISGDSYSNSN
jgi:hypothetical protein